jgi:hypothetical protein
MRGRDSWRCSSSGGTTPSSSCGGVGSSDNKISSKHVEPQAQPLKGDAADSRKRSKPQLVRCHAAWRWHTVRCNA